MLIPNSTTVLYAHLGMGEGGKFFLQEYKNKIIVVLGTRLEYTNVEIHTLSKQIV